VVLQGTPYFGQLLPILGSAAAFFVVILPYSLNYEFSRLSRSVQRGEAETTNQSSGTT